MASENPTIPAEAIAALSRGDKIEAIKLIREKTGMSLKEAKEAVESCESGKNYVISSRVSNSSMDMPYDAIIALEQGNKIEAIKVYREANRVGLKDSKDAVEAYLAGNPPINQKFRRAGAGGRKFFTICLLLIVAVIVYKLLKG